MKINSQSVLRTAYRSIALTLFLFISGLSYSQSCNDVQISIPATPTDNTCTVTIMPDMITEGDPEGGYIRIFNGPFLVSQGTSATIIGADAYFGVTLTAHVYANATPTGSYCWGTILLEDKSNPVIDCSAVDNVSINCTQSLLETDFVPTAADNCSDATVQLINQVIDNSDQCGAGVTVERTWIAIDAMGNTSDPCSQTITINRVLGVDFPEDIAFYCGDYASNPNVLEANTLTCSGLLRSDELNALDATLAPADCLATTGAGRPNIAEGTYCNYVISHNDNVLEACENADNTTKIIRTWTVMDWCTSIVINFNDIDGNGVQNTLDETVDGVDYNQDGDMDDTAVLEEDNVQVILAIDNRAPSIIIPANADLVLSANQYASNSQTCRSLDFLPVPTIEDECSSFGYTVYTSIGEVIFVNDVPRIPTPGLSIGVHTVTYTVTDGCGNISELDVDITVQDDITPTPVCEEITQVAIGGTGTATVFANSFDDGSNDNCGISTFQVRRMDETDYSESVNFDCEDIIYDADGNPLSINVILRVTDYTGNFNECMVQVLVEDKLDPSLVQCLTAQSITCQNYFNNLAPALDIAEADGDTNPQVLMDMFGTPVFSDNCEVNLSSAVTRDLNSCGVGTITRTFTATDDQGNSSPACSQVITVEHVNDWEVQFPDDITLECQVGVDEIADQNLGEAAIFFDDCEMIAVSIEETTFNVVPDACYKLIRTFTVINWCVYDGTNLNDDMDLGDRRFRDVADGVVTYTQQLKVIDEINPVITNPGTQTFEITGFTDIDGDCDISIELPEAVVTDCSETVTISYELVGEGVGRNFSDMEIGQYQAVVTAVDNCGNQSTINYDVEIKDAKSPTPACHDVIIELMPVDSNGDGTIDNGMVEIWASDFNYASFDNCTVSDSLVYTATLGTNDYASSTSNLMLTCDHVGNNDVYMYVADEAGNVDACLVNLEVESVDNVCGDQIVVFGLLQNEANMSLPGATIALNNNANSTAISDENGAYQIIAEYGSDVTVSPSYDENHDEGVSTIDLVIIRKHILNTQLLNSPYKLIAADANNSGTITAADLVVIKAVILGNNSYFPNNASWVFVDQHYNFSPDWTLQDGYPAVSNVNNISSEMEMNFVAIKIGDVNNSFNPFDAGMDSRNSNNTFITIEDAFVSKGEIIEVEFELKQKEWEGYQFALTFEGIDLVGNNASPQDVNVTKNTFKTSKVGDNLSNEIIKLTFLATSNVTLREAIKLDRAKLNPEVYQNGETLNLNLEFNSIVEPTVMLYQNVPNPIVNGQVAISFDLPSFGLIKMTIHDITGKVIAQQIENRDQGQNTIQFVGLNTPGIYTYTLTFKGINYTKKMVII